MPTSHKTSIPSSSKLSAMAQEASFSDAYQIELNPPQPYPALEMWLMNIHKTPVWVEMMMRVRNSIVSRLGLKDLGELSMIDPHKRADEYRIGERLGIFTLIHIAHDELVLGDSDKHLNVQVSLLVQNSGRELVVSTVVHEHNWLGRVYICGLSNPCIASLLPLSYVGLQRKVISLHMQISEAAIKPECLKNMGIYDKHGRLLIQ